MERESADRDSASRRRWLPRTLGGRLIATVVLLALTTTAVTLFASYLLMTPLADGPAASRVVQVAVEAVVLSGGLAVVTGLALGLFLTRIVRRPVERMVERVKAKGRLAVDGGAADTKAIDDDPSLPKEFRELGAVVDDLLAQLSRRQQELEGAIAHARWAEESLGMVVSEAREAKIVLEGDRIVIANPAASAALSLPRSELLDRTFADAFDGTVVLDERETTLTPATLLERSLDQPVAVRLERPGAAPRWHIFQAARHAEDHRDRVLISAQDITEDRRLQGIRSEILALISHDLRSPLAVVVGYLDLLRKPLTDDERDRAIASAKRNAGRMADLLEDLLTATRAEELLEPAALLPIDLAGLAEEVVTSMAPTHDDRPLAIEAMRAPVVRGEERRLRQVLVNLVTNAFKYSPAPRTVTVRVDATGSAALLHVVDHGPGVAPEDRERVFERFTRVPGTSADRPGTGLGLYIVRTIAENHGGCARVTETPGGGATFTIELPLAGWVREDGFAMNDAALPELEGSGEPGPATP